LLVLVALSLLGWIYLTQASRVATTSRRVQKLERELTRLEQENLQLMAEIAALETVSRLAARATELGFVMAMAQDADFLVVADPALAYTARDIERDPSDTGWWDNVTAQFTAWARVGGQ
jgi:hypothetical protein